MRSIIVALVLALMAAGCATNMPAPNFASNFGTPPTNIEAAVKAHFNDILFDPFTAHYEIGTPYKAYLRAGLIQGGGIAWQGWAVDVRVNAKNRMGGYVGWTLYHATFDGNTVVDAFEYEPVDVLFHRVE